MSFLHTRSPPVVHLDLKPANVLLGDVHQAKVADFGLARQVTGRDVTNKSMGTIAYMPPEALNRAAGGVKGRDEMVDEDGGTETQLLEGRHGGAGKLDTENPEDPQALVHRKCAWDIYSFAIMMASVLGGCPVYDQMSNNEIYLAVAIRGERTELKPTMPEQLQNLIKQMWVTDLTKRPLFKV